MSDMSHQTPSDDTADQTSGRIDRALETIAAVRAGVGGAILGQERVIDLTLATILAGGHGLLVGAPGLAKTRLVEAVAIATGLDWGRVQFTPDLMPSDIIGSEILDQDSNGKRSFRFVQGPVFTSLLMADEINRASPRTQSALLQAMQEGQVTVSGVTYSLPEPFFVLATQNPIEQEGTYPLPEAQLDRFLLQIDVPFPDRETERQVLLATTGEGDLVAKAALKPGELANLQSFVRSMPVGEKILDGVLDLVRSARPESATDPEIRNLVAWGPGPRAGQALIKAAKARAFLRGRVSPSLDDVTAIARAALAHRMALTWRARADGLDLAKLIDRLVLEALRPA
ncbi:MoxR family ATPase [Aquidulcibacter sp.]|uniref:AAA family ATPase n=1 Tax=Aquidulcibacter sp. TaxID=2052990 RepID=UPI0025BF1583|nr:MoxR family ATPase [Aquidulcibacter sp.]MCA3692115.1 MoxR family ATPase [Aquidulcibacter sp.]